MKEIFNDWIRVDNSPLNIDNLSIILGGKITVDIDGVRNRFASAMDVSPNGMMIDFGSYGIFYCRVIGGLLHLSNNTDVLLIFKKEND